MIYLDHNATTSVSPEVRVAMLPYLKEAFGNPSSAYPFGQEAKRALEEVRSEVADCLGAAVEREIIFTSGGTESNYLAISSALKAYPERRKIVTTQVEHSSVKNHCLKLADEGYEVVWVGVKPTGAIDLTEFEAAVTSDTAIVSVMWANNETGVIFPIFEIARIAKQKDALIHVDAVQAVGKIPVDVSEAHIDYLSLSAHKLYGPKGTGALFARESAPIRPVFRGGGQESGRRPGTENVPGIAGLGCALRAAVDELERQMVRVAPLRKRLEDGILGRVSESYVNGRDEPRLTNTTNITIPVVDAEAFLIRLGEAGICASAGSACLSGALEPSHVLKAMGRSREHVLSSVRFSLGKETTSEEIDETIEVVSKLAEELRSLKQAGSK